MKALKTYPSYKDSGIEWIGKIPTNWQINYFKRSFKVKNGREVPDDGTYLEENIDVYGSGGVFKKTCKHLYNGESVLFGRKGTIGKPLFVTGKFWTVDTMYYTEFRNNMIPRYYYYLLNLYPWSLITTQTALPSVVGTDVENSECVIPGTLEQVAITHFLDDKTSEIDSLIADKEKLIELLEEKRQAIITEAVTKGLNPNVKMKDSGVEWIGEIPGHWEIKKVKHLSTYVGSGKTPRGGGEIYTNEGVMFLRSMNVHFEGLRLDEIVYVDPKIDEDMKSTRIQSDDVLLNITGASIGRTCIVPNNFPPANVNQHVCIIRPSKLGIVPSLLSKIIGSQIVQEQILMAQNGSSREGLNFPQVRNLIFPLSKSIEEQRDISNYIEDQTKAIYKTISDITLQIKKLKDYRQSLIYEAVTGKIDVRDYKKVLS